MAKASYVAETSSIDRRSLDDLVVGSAGYIDGLIDQAKGFDRAELSAMVEYLDRLEQTCRRSSQPILNLEMGLLALCHRHDIVMVRELVDRVNQLEEVLKANELIPPSRHPGTKPATQAKGAPAVSSMRAAAQPDKGSGAIERSNAALEAGGTNQSGKTTFLMEDEAGVGALSVIPTRNHSGQEGITIVVPGADKSSGVSGGRVKADSVPPESVASKPEGKSPAELVRPSGVTGAVSDDTVQPQDERRSEKIGLVDDGAPADAPLTTSLPEALSDEDFTREQDQRLLLEETWSGILEELQRRSLPTYSLVYAHAFPLRLEDDSLTIGVRVENFQKMIEGKAEHIKGAGLTVVGRPLSVKVKVVALEPAGKTSLRTRARPNIERKENSGGGKAGENGGRSHDGHAGSAGSSDDDDERVSSDMRTGDQELMEKSPEKAPPSRMEPVADATLIQEAYRL